MWPPTVRHTVIISSLAICVSLTWSKRRHLRPDSTLQTTQRIWLITNPNLKLRWTMVLMGKGLHGVAAMAWVAGLIIVDAKPAANQAGTSIGVNLCGKHWSF